MSIPGLAKSRGSSSAIALMGFTWMVLDMAEAYFPYFMTCMGGTAIRLINLAILSAPRLLQLVPRFFVLLAISLSTLHSMVPKLPGILRGLSYFINPPHLPKLYSNPSRRFVDLRQVQSYNPFPGGSNQASS